MFSLNRYNTKKKSISKKAPREIVLIFPYNTETNKIFIIREYIHHYERSFWKFISGGIDKEGKDNLTHAHEELAEEVAMNSKNLYHFYSFEKIFGNRGIHCFIAENPQLLDIPPENPDDDIIEKGEWISEQEFYTMLDENKMIWNEGAMVAVQIFRKYRNK